jgi:HK97 family phage major capsid protein
MDPLTRSAIRRAQDALTLATTPTRDTREDGRHLALLADALINDQPVPDAARREHDALRERGHVPERGGTLVSFERLFTRDLLGGTASGTAKGGNLVGSNNAGLLVEESGIVPAVIAAGAQVVTGLTGSIKIPTLASVPAASWVAEGAAPSEADMTFGKIDLVPHTLTCHLDVSRRLALQSSLSMDGLLRAYLQRAVARAIDQAALVGTGLSNEPLGVIGTSGVTQVAMGTDGAALSRINLAKLIAPVADANGLAPDSRPGFLLPSKALLVAFATPTESYGSNYLYSPGGNPNGGRLGEFPAFLANNLPVNGTKGSGTNLATIAFGDWSKLLIGVWGAIEVVVNPYTLSTTGGLRMHIFADLSIAILQPSAFTYASDVVTS